MWSFLKNMHLAKFSLITWNLQGAHLRVLGFNEAAGDLVWVQLWRGTKWNFKEKELQRVWATIADGVYSSSRSKAAQIRSPVLRSQPTTLASTREALSVGGLITPILCAAGVNPTDRRATEPGWMDIKFCKTNLLIEHKELDGRFQFKFTHPLAGPSKLLLPNPELTTVVGVRTLTSDPLCTH
ncbi:unnamed protein product [Microthlaspi erraticum]|uniref:Arabidopsis retrotransposon Orf1 C-terminal domain-containing protein n=1 Tax=Microthlaspi erraticum TaxID=1685480 RepID=A0A6D2KAM5_9BRAS|nr:unnamed protein product [Microthlaspi erraticum]